MPRDIGAVRTTRAGPRGVPTAVPLHFAPLPAERPVDVPEPHGLGHDGKSRPSLRQPKGSLDNFLISRNETPRHAGSTGGYLAQRCHDFRVGPRES